MIKTIRLFSQQLINPQFKTPKELISWMGAVQAQDFKMVKWAIGMRLPDGNIKTVEEAIDKGDIIRTHVLRPTWHLAAAEDIRWMLKLSEKRILSANAAYWKRLEIPSTQYNKGNKAFEQILSGNISMTRQELICEFEKRKLINIPDLINSFLMNAEAEGIICSGASKNGKHTYALLEERILPQPKLNKDESLQKLARKYFQSHSPATLEDFVWWSGLSITESRKAVDSIKEELVAEIIGDKTFFIHNSFTHPTALSDNSIHLLPPYDEYLISYKDRTDVLEKNHYPKAFTNYGIFYPVVMYNGKVIGNWKKTNKKESSVVADFFLQADIDNSLLESAIRKYISFYTD